MVQFLPAPLRLYVVLGEKQQKEDTTLDLRNKVVAEDITRLELMIDEEVLA